MRLILCLFLIFNFGIFGYSENNKLRVNCYFEKECESKLIQLIDLSNEDIYIAIYCFTDKKIANALKRAYDRGVYIEIKYDNKQYKFNPMGKLIKYLRSCGIKVIPVTMKDKRDHMHNKFVVIDRKIVWTGSYNFTVSAMYNYENAVRIDSKAVAKRFISEFKQIKSR